MESPFITHKDKVLGYYNAAACLRSVVLSLWSGDYPADLSRLAEFDEDHMDAALAMMKSYRRNRVNDKAFVALAHDCLARREEARAAVARNEQLEAWLRETGRQLRLVGLSTGLVDDRYSWFAAQFEAGTGPVDAAQRAASTRFDEQ